MGLAKFKEEINERYLDAVFPAPRSIAPAPTAPQPVTSDVRALNLDGSPVEDLVVFTTEQKLDFIVSSNAPMSAIRVSLQQEPPGMKLNGTGERQFTIGSSKPGSGRLLLICGAYHKAHQVAFIQPTRPDSIPEVDTLLKNLDTNPVTWNATYGQSLHDRLARILKKHDLPPEFGDGVYEYHLGLVHEAEGDGRFVERLERAFALLKPFSRHSPYTNLVCRYFLLRVNEFAPLGIKRATSVLDRACAFFAQPFKPCSEPRRDRAANSVQPRAGSLELLIALPDCHLLEAVGAYECGDVAKASVLLDAARESRNAEDPQRDAKLSFLAARIARSMNERRAAVRHYTSLQFSPCEFFRQESVEYCANVA